MPKFSEYSSDDLKSNAINITSANGALHKSLVRSARNKMYDDGRAPTVRYNKVVSPSRIPIGIGARGKRIFP